MRKITIDIETKGDFKGNGDFSNQEVTVACIHDSETDNFSSFYKDELPQLWGILERADLIIGYNSDHFDIPILDRYYPGDLSTIASIDLLKEVKAVLGRRLRMDNLAEATLGRKKTGHGLEAVEWWNQGLFEKVRDYCIEDVRITKELYEYARDNKSLKYRDFDGVREIKLDPSGWEKAAEGSPSMTHTLPF